MGMFCKVGKRCCREVELGMMVLFDGGVWEGWVM